MKMKEIKRYDIHENWAHSGIIQAGDYCFINYCVRNTGGTIEEQINGAFDEMEERLALVQEQWAVRIKPVIICLRIYW